LYLRRGIISEKAALEVISQAEKFLKGREYMLDSEDIMKCLLKSSCTAYDCEFVALAQKLSVPLITMNKKILSEFPHSAVNISDFVK